MNETPTGVEAASVLPDTRTVSLLGRAEAPVLDWYLEFQPARSWMHGSLYDRVKRLLDVSLVLLFLPVILPVGALLWIVVRLEYPRVPAVFLQMRTGKDGRRFRMLKFRTMVPDADRLKTELAHLNERRWPDFKIEDDPRITRVGNLLRSTSLDELPQLWNVLKGDMSLVGPRPPLPAEVAQYDRWQRRRLSMKPGITCLWQVGGRNDVDFDTWMKLDMEYIDNWSLFLDIKILLKTIPVVLTAKGAH